MMERKPILITRLGVAGIGFTCFTAYIGSGPVTNPNAQTAVECFFLGVLMTVQSALTYHLLSIHGDSLERSKREYAYALDLVLYSAGFYYVVRGLASTLTYLVGPDDITKTRLLAFSLFVVLFVATCAFGQAKPEILRLLGIRRLHWIESKRKPPSTESISK